MTSKLPAIKSSIGNWNYYVSSLTLEQVSSMVDSMNDEIYQSSSLKEALQRSVTENYKNIKQYILSQPERFFNSLVLAIYDGEPNWIDIELELEGETFYNMGFLTLNGQEHIFPVDGQHRVEGIKAALVDPSVSDTLKHERISVVFVGHKKTIQGMQKSRRLFNVLNRYAKPVSKTDIIILDEDDSGSLATRYLIEDSDKVKLFKNERLDSTLQKAINQANKKAFTSLISLNECNIAIQKYYFKTVFKDTNAFNEYKALYFNEKRTMVYSDFQKYRPGDQTLLEFIEFTERFWEKFEEAFPFVQEYLSNTNEYPAETFRESTTGGNILFRPIGIVPFVEAVVKVLEKDVDATVDNIFSRFTQKEYLLNSKPWKNTVWSPQEHNMITAPKVFIRNMFVFLVDKTLLTENELITLKNKYASFIAHDEPLGNVSLENLLED